MNRPKSNPESVPVNSRLAVSVELTDKGREVRRKNISSFVLGRNLLSHSVLLGGKEEGPETMRVEPEFRMEDYFRTGFLNKESGEIQSILDEKLRDENTYDWFVKVYAKKLNFGVGVEKVLQEDSELREAFIDYVYYNLNGDQGDENSGKVFRKKAAVFQSRLLKYSTKKTDLDVSELLEGFRRGIRIVKIDSILVSDQDFLDRREVLYTQFNTGEITKEELVSGIESLYGEKVAESDNEELKALWGSTATEEKSGKDFKVALDATIGDMNATPVSSKEETVDAVAQANNAFADTNFSADYVGGGVAKVRISEFEADLRIFKDNDTDEFVYFLNDRYTHGQMMGPFKDTDLAEALDSRRIDAYLTSRIGKMATNSSDVEGIKDLPDVTVEKIGKKLIGGGEGRKFDIMSDERGVLDKFVLWLLKKDEKLGTVESKIEKLNTYLNSKARVDGFKVALMEDRVENVSVLA